jgi:hypothetical protein
LAALRLDAPAKADIDRILRETITNSAAPEFMAPPARSIEPWERVAEASQDNQ